MRKAHKNQVLHRLLEYCDRNNLYVDYYHGISEAGYDDKPMLCADWNPDNMKRIYNWAESYFKDEIGLNWSDEWTSCSDCYKAIRTSPNSYAWQPSYVWSSDCTISCCECYEDVIDDIIEYYRNDTNLAVPSGTYSLLEQEGFVCYSPDE